MPTTSSTRRTMRGLFDVSVDIRRPPGRSVEGGTVTTTGITARATCGQVRRAQHEQSARGVDVAVLTTRERGVVRSEDLLTAGMVSSETVRMRLSERSTGPLLARHNRIL